MHSWREALRSRTFTYGFPIEEVKRFVLNFCTVHFFTRDLQLQDGLHPNSEDEDMVDDLDMSLGDEDLAVATLTHVRGAGKAHGGQDDDRSEEEGAEAAAEVRAEAKPQQDKRPTLFDMTMDMTRLSSSIYLAPERLQQPDAEAQAHHQQMLQAGKVSYHALARKSADASKKNE